jgi:TPR repeat protein
LGVCFGSGRGVEQNDSVANDWYEKAAKQGHADAQYKLAHSYRVGRGTKVNFAIALQWYQGAADAGDLQALQNIGHMYAAGLGVEADSKEAFARFLLGAKKGSTSSQYEVANRLRTGEGIPSNMTESYSWFLVLQAERKSFAASDWAQVQALINSVESDLEPGSKIAAERLSRERLREISQEKILRLAK